MVVTITKMCVMFKMAVRAVVEKSWKKVYNVKIIENKVCLDYKNRFNSSYVN